MLPLMRESASEARKRTTEAISSGWPAEGPAGPEDAIVVDAIQARFAALGSWLGYWMVPP
jgi:hypothetical protein